VFVRFLINNNFIAFGLSAAAKVRSLVLELHEGALR